MRIAREDWSKLHPSDVAWVTEWQLSDAFPWVPIGEESPVYADPRPDPVGRGWAVQVRAGGGIIRARLPVRDLARVISWCHGVSRRTLRRPPAFIRASLAALRAALREGLADLNPLDRMGYSAGGTADRESGA